MRPLLHVSGTEDYHSICSKLTALIGGWLLAGAHRAVEVSLLQDLSPIDDAIAVALLVAIIAKASWAVVACHQTASA